MLLRRHADAPVDGVAVDPRAFREPAEGDLDLGRELARRRQDEGPRPARGLFHESLKDRQQEGGRLAGARLRRPDDVATGEDRRDCLLLDWRRGLVSEAVYRPDENRVKAELVKGALRVRDLHRGSYGFIGLRIPTAGRGRGKTYLTSSPFPGSAVSRGVDSMKGERSRREWTGPEYRIRVSFGVPLDFAFAWCTDYTSEDASLEGESYQRKIIERTPDRVIFEDLEESDDGWNWSRDVVTLSPPNKWHMDGIGNRRDVTADYVLSPLPDGRTRFDLRWSRRPKVPDAKKLTKAEREASTMQAWKRFAAAMERDYRRSQHPRRASR